MASIHLIARHLTTKYHIMVGFKNNRDMKMLSSLLALFMVNPLVTGGFLSPWISDKEPWRFLVVCPNTLLNKQSNYRWFETPRRQCDVTVMRWSGQPCISCVCRSFDLPSAKNIPHFIEYVYLLFVHNTHGLQLCLNSLCGVERYQNALMRAHPIMTVICGAW